MTKELQEIYANYCTTSSDINEHLPTLKDYAERCQTVTEFGVRTAVSTIALLAAQPERLHSYDINEMQIGDFIYRIAQENEVDFKFFKQDVLKAVILPTDMLFIDTFHVYEQLKHELSLHAAKVKKYIIFHDTATFGEKGESPDGITQYQGLNKAIFEFMEQNPCWGYERVYSNNNGLTIIKRMQ